MKWCAHCQQSKPLDEFYRSSKSGDGRQWRCIPCAKSSVKARYESDLPANRAAARDRVWRRNQNPEVREAKRAADRAAYLANPEQYKAAADSRRERKRSAAVGEVTQRDWRRIVARQHGCCHYCGELSTLTEDHLIPLIRGGAHSIGNIVGACDRCNRQKGRKTRMEYRVWLRRTAAA